MGNQEALEPCALVGQFPNLVQDKISDLLVSGVGLPGIFLARNELPGVDEMVGSAGVNFINDGGFQVYVLPSACLTEEGVGVISSPSRSVTWHLAIGLGDLF